MSTKNAVEPIVIEQSLKSPIEKVWKAITDKDQMKKWFFAEIESFEPEVGFKTRFTVRCEGKDFVHLWEVTQVSRGMKIEYGWRYEGYPGDSRVIWDLSVEDGRTKVRLTHEVNETFPQDMPVFSRESGIAGWTYFVNQRLKEFVES